MNAPLIVEVIDDVAAWDAIRDDWASLYRASPSAATPLDFVWLRCWWEVYGPVYGAGGLRILSFRRDTRLVAVAPLYLKVNGSGPFATRCLRFLSTGEAEFEETCPDYLNLLHLPGEEIACAEAFWDAVEDMEWDTLELLDLPSDSPLRIAAERRGWIRISSRGSCPIARLDAGFEAYLGSLSSKTRMRARQEMRKAIQSGVALELAGPAEVTSCFADLVQLHQARWKAEGKPGCFAAPRFTRFHERLLQEWPAPERIVLARLAHGGDAVVVLYGFITAGKFDLYQLGVGAAEGTSMHSPGMAANLLLMERLAQQGVAGFDFLRGDSAFKRSLSSELAELVVLGATRMNPRMLLVHVRHFGRRLWRRLLRMSRWRLEPTGRGAS
ncbi:MAG TPA: GNAT family N-acetyltransferase [Rhodanobacter sp.]|nr:GNAT family N-acetyltransferase [Rhodanobacter sp.]